MQTPQNSYLQIGLEISLFTKLEHFKYVALITILTHQF